VELRAREADLAAKTETAAGEYRDDALRTPDS
jgi:hypothetical protein